MPATVPCVERSLLLAVDRCNSPLAGEAHRQAFCPYGTRTVLCGIAGASGFNGEYLERSDRYVLGSYRAYSPALRRFCQPDHLSPFRAGGVNAYAYCLGDPVNRVDRDGHASVFVPIVSMLVMTGASIGAGLTEGHTQKTLSVAALFAAGFSAGSGWKVLHQRQRASRVARSRSNSMQSTAPEEITPFVPQVFQVDVSRASLASVRPGQGGGFASSPSPSLPSSPVPSYSESMRARYLAGSTTGSVSSRSSIGSGSTGTWTGFSRTNPSPSASRESLWPGGRTPEPSPVWSIRRLWSL